MAGSSPAKGNFWRQIIRSSSASLDRDVLVGRGVGEQRDPAEPGLADPRPDAVDEGELPDRRVHRPLVYDLLHLVQDRLALLRIDLDRLLTVQLVDFGVAAVGEPAALDHICL